MTPELQVDNEQVSGGVNEIGVGNPEGSLYTTLGSAVTILSIAIGFIALIVIIYSGFKIITSQGDASAYASGRKGILYAGVGLAIIILSQVFIRLAISIFS